MQPGLTGPAGLLKLPGLRRLPVLLVLLGLCASKAFRAPKAPKVPNDPKTSTASRVQGSHNFLSSHSQVFYSSQGYTYAEVGQKKIGQESATEIIPKIHLYYKKSRIGILRFKINPSRNMKNI